MNHKYLNELGIKSDDSCVFNTTEIDGCGRQESFMKEREEHGFDSRETWSLGFTLVTWLYEHLKVFMDYADGFINLNYHHFHIPVLHEIPQENLEFVFNGVAKQYYNTVIEEHSQREAILLMLDYFEYFLKNNNSCSLEIDGRAYEKVECAIKIFADAFGTMWW